MAAGLAKAEVLDADAMEMYKNFRGNEPSIDPLLKNRGLKK